MTVHVVHKLEAVEVHAKERELLLCPLRMADRLARQFHEKPAVRQVGQRVVQREVRRARFRFLAPCQVADGEQLT